MLTLGFETNIWLGTVYDFFPQNTNQEYLIYTGVYSALLTSEVTE